jgi:alanine racemase
MARPARIELNTAALLHNITRVKAHAPGQSVIAMVKGNAYGCGIAVVVPVLDAVVDAFGVASIEEAKAARMHTNKPCILLGGIFSEDELSEIVDYQLDVVVHHKMQLQWLLNTRLKTAIRVWVKVDTGMHRLGLMPDELGGVITALNACKWVQPDIGVMTHLASVDTPEAPQNQLQYDRFQALKLPEDKFIKTIANSAAILAYGEKNQAYDAVRPGIMLYGVSPFAESDGAQFDLKPVMTLISAITAIHDYLPGEPVGYAATWETRRASRIGVVAIGYGDGYPRHIANNTPVYIEGHYVPIVGRVSMDMLTVDLTDYPEISIGNRVELWGAHLPVEQVARAAGTIGYELITQVTSRVRENQIIS